MELVSEAYSPSDGASRMGGSASDHFALAKESVQLKSTVQQGVLQPLEHSLLQHPSDAR